MRNLGHGEAVATATEMTPASRHTVLGGSRLILPVVDEPVDFTLPLMDEVGPGGLSAL